MHARLPCIFGGTALRGSGRGHGGERPADYRLQLPKLLLSALAI